MPAESVDFERGDYPALYRAADGQSEQGQRRYLCSSRLRLALVVAASATGLASVRVGEVELLGVIGAIAFVTALVLELSLRNTRPDRRWYDGRAAAESTKSLTWRYAVGGNPFPASLGESADNAFVRQLAEVMAVAPGRHLVPEDERGEQITDTMRALRTSDLAHRRDAYRNGRILDQKSWYGRRAHDHDRSLRGWSNLLMAAEIVGAGAAVLRAADVLEIDLAALAAVLVAVAVAWTETRQYGTLANAYAVAHHELGMIEARIAEPDTEDQWAVFVDEAEEAISREHTLWRASWKT